MNLALDAYGNCDKNEDLLNEIVTIGSGSASTVLTEIFNHKISVEIKNIKADLNKITDKILQYKTNDYFMVSQVSGFINGVIIFNSKKNSGIYEHSDFFKFANIEKYPQEEIIYEIFNIGISHYLSSIANFINEKITVNQIEFNKEESKLLLEVFNNIDEYICIDTSVVSNENNETLGGYLFFISKKSLDKLINRFKSYKILICDDTSFMRVIAREIIQKNYPDIVIEEAKNGKEAFEKFVEFEPDLVIMDLIMPECDGIQATEQILKVNPDAKIIITSTTVIELQVIKALKAGAKDFITKPYNNQQVLGLVKKFLPAKKHKINHF